MDILVS